MRTLVNNGEKRCHIGQRRDQHLVAPANRQGQQSQMQCGGTAGHGHAMGAAAVLGELLLERRQVVSKMPDIAPCFRASFT